MKQALFVVNGPSGAGKSHLLRYVDGNCNGVSAIPKLTTRPRMASEKDAPWSDLIHVTQSEFARHDPEYHYTWQGFRYGFTRAVLEGRLRAARACLVVVRDLSTIHRLGDDLQTKEVIPLFVIADRDMRRQRLLGSGLNAAEVERRLAWDDDPDGHYRDHADLYRICLDNDSTIEAFQYAIAQVLSDYLAS